MMRSENTICNLFAKGPIDRIECKIYQASVYLDHGLANAKTISGHSHMMYGPLNTREQLLEQIVYSLEFYVNIITIVQSWSAIHLLNSKTAWSLLTKQEGSG